MTKLQELLDQQAALTREISTARAAERSRAIAEIRTLMAQHGLTQADVAGAMSSARQASQSTRKKVAIKYRDPATGKTWTGRGLKPKWMSEQLAAGKSIGDFLV